MFVPAFYFKAKQNNNPSSATQDTHSYLSWMVLCLLHFKAELLEWVVCILGLFFYPTTTSQLSIFGSLASPPWLPRYSRATTQLAPQIIWSCVTPCSPGLCQYLLPFNTLSSFLFVSSAPLAPPLLPSVFLVFLRNLTNSYYSPWLSAAALPALSLLSSSQLLPVALLPLHVTCKT